MRLFYFEIITCLARVKSRVAPALLFLALRRKATTVILRMKRKKLCHHMLFVNHDMLPIFIVLCVYMLSHYYSKLAINRNAVCVHPKNANA